MSDKFYIGLDLTGFENNGIQRPISRVTLLMDDEHVLTAGDDTGVELSADCPHATQAMVNSLLAQLKGSTYKMYSASDANLDPSAELGDGITASGVYSVISRLADDGMGFPSPSAPGKEELEDEYPAGGPMTQAFERKISETRSSITKTANQIRLEVERIDNNVTDLSTSITVELGKITNSIQDINGNYSQLEQTINSFSLSVSNGETSSTISLKAGEAVISSQNIIMNGLVTFQGLANGTTTINGGCIKTGTIESMRIDSSTITGTSISGGTITGTTINGGKFYSEIYIPEKDYKPAVELWDGAVRFFFNDQDSGQIVANQFGGISVSGGNSVTISTDDAIATMLGVYGDNITLGVNPEQIIYCNCNIDMRYNSILNTSDRRLKTNITESDLNAISVINSMKTYSFDWEENGLHEKLGFIAQQLEEINPDFVNVNQADGHYSTKDMKIIPYLVKAVQELSEKIDKLEGATE